MLVSAMHVFFDVVAGGPTWPVFPLWPFSDLAWTVSWSWTLAEWPNSVILFACLAGTMLYARVAARSPMESVNYGFEKWFVRIIEHGSDSLPETSREPGTQAVGIPKAMRVRIIVYVFLIFLVLAVLAPLGFQLDLLNLPQF
jgi:hypothetical protein